MFDHVFITEEISVASWSTTSSDTAINDWSTDEVSNPMELESTNLQPAVVLQRLSPSNWPLSDDRQSDISSTDAVMQPVVMLERLPPISTPSEVSSNSDMVDQHISFQWTRTVLGPLPIMAESPQPSPISVSDNWSFQEMSATTTTLQPVVILQRLPSPNWSFQQITAMAQPVVALQRLNIPLPNLSDNGFQEEETTSGLKACCMEPTVVLQRLSPFLHHLPYSSTKELDSSKSSLSQNYPVTNCTWSASSSSTDQVDTEDENDLDAFVKQPTILLEQLPAVNLPSNSTVEEADVGANDWQPMVVLEPISMTS